MNAPFPLSFANDEISLLTAVGLGFLFGFSLERGGFGNARKLAAQFYLYDMTVFKVMFTAIIVAMVGLYTLAGLGWMDLSMLWINPTFLWAQLLGGFLLGVGFIMSGLCPGTSVVSAASGRLDAVVTMLGIGVGTAVFAVAIAWIPAIELLYTSGSLGVSVLPDVFGMPPLAFSLGVVALAGAGFLGAEKVEAIFAGRYTPVELTPAARPHVRMRLIGATALVALLAMGVPTGSDPGLPVQIASLSPMSLAEAIIARAPNMMILDVRAEEEARGRIPGAYPARSEEDAQALLSRVAPGSVVVLVDAEGAVKEIPSSWPAGVDYRYLQDGFLGWELRVLTPMPPGETVEDRLLSTRQAQISGYFTGAAVELSDAPPPPPMAGGAGAKPKKKGGC